MSLPSSGMLFPWEECYLIASPTSHHFYVGSLPTLFCEKRQKLFGLNATADCIWRHLTDGRTPAQVSSELIKMGFVESEAVAFVRSATASWLNAGHLTPREVLDLLAEPPAATRNVRIHDLALQICFRGSASPKTFDDVFGHFCVGTSDLDTGLSVVGYREAFFIFEANRPLIACSGHEVVPHLKAILTERYVSSVESGFLVHAALLAKNNSTLLICGSPGAGKTTLSVALVGSGYSYCSDDIVRIERDGAATGVPFLPAVKTGAWSLVAPYAPHIAELPTYRRADGQDVRYLSVRTFANEPRIVSDIVVLAREPGAAVVLDVIEPLEALSILLESGFSTRRALEADTLKTFARAIESARCRRLFYSDLAEAARAIASGAHE